MIKKNQSELKYKRILLKLSGEVLGGETETGIDFVFLKKLGNQLKAVKNLGVQLSVVIGGGNFWRFRDFSKASLSRVNSDYLGMLATIMNSIALQDELIDQEVEAKVYSALSFPQITDDFVTKQVNSAMQKGVVAICAGGTGNPFCTTDSAAALRAAELQCDLMIKATNVDYVYDKDPRKFKNAKPYKTIKYDEILSKELQVMDLGAIVTAKEAKIPIVILNLSKPKNVLEVLQGKNIGTFIN